MKLQLELIEETFINKQSQEDVKGVTVIIDGEIKSVLDLIIKIDPSYRNYSHLIAEALIRGNKGTVGGMK